MNVIVDNNLPRSLARVLSVSGSEAAHVIDPGLSQATDQQLRARFAAQPIVFVSRDGDFWLQHPAAWAVVWIAIHNPTLAYLRGPVSHQLSALIPTLTSGQRALLAADQVRVFGAS